MIIHSEWKPKGPSEFVTDSEGREYEIATFEGGKRRIDRLPTLVGDMGTAVRASVFLKGGLWQFAIDTEAQLAQIQAAFVAVREEARRRILKGNWQAGSTYPL